MSELTADQACQHALRLHQAGRLNEAEAVYRGILAQQPAHADSLHLLGMIAFQRGQTAAALPFVEQAVKINPNIAIYHNNLGQVLERLGRRQEATAHYDRALTLDPRYSEAHNNRANMAERAGQLPEAIAGYRRAIQLRPQYGEAFTNLGNIYKDQGDLDEAITCYRAAIAREPRPLLHDNLLLALHYHPAYGPAELAEEHRDWAQRYAAPLRRPNPAYPNPRDSEKRLRIGYVSPDYRDHAVGRFLRPLLQHHDRTRFELFAYADPAVPDRETEKFKQQVDVWRDVTHQPDAAVADLVRRDQIDILVDLAAHTAGSRLLAFAEKPAPVQATYLAYCSTTGVDTIDYRITDPYLDPPGTDLGHYVEETVRLPHTYWCFAPPDSAVAQAEVRPRDQTEITFGCLNNFCKVTPASLRAWAQILRRVPHAQIIIYTRPGSHRERVRDVFRAAGVANKRVRFVAKQSFDDYFATFQAMDIGLDPFPFNGGTTTCDTLWMGVPVVTLAGRTAVARGGQSLLSNIGHSELVTRTEEDYIRLAVELAVDRPRLARLRAQLRSQMQASPLMDAPRFARDLEAAYRTMWRRWCERRAP